MIAQVRLEAFLDVAVDLLAIPSTVDRPEELCRAVEAVVEYVGEGFVVERFASNEKPSALLYSSRYRGGPRPFFRLILNAHLDVVPAHMEQFRPVREAGRLFARGAQDMKVSALAQALVFRELADAVPYPLALQLVADEEVGGRDGTLHQLEQGVSGQFVLIGEHSGLNIVADAKGMLHVVLLAEGRSAHGAYPWLGDNALANLVTSVGRLLERYPAPVEEAWRTTVSVARIVTPNQAFNQIPDRAEAWLDIRFPAEDAELGDRTREEIAGYLGSFCAPGVTVRIDEFDPPQHADHDRAEIGGLRRAARAHGGAGELIRKHGASDGGFYSARGTAAVAFGVEGAGQHGPHEHVELASIEPYYLALHDFVQRLEMSD
jgi:succinyl-diaminopimelate desuccinylase